MMNKGKWALAALMTTVGIAATTAPAPAAVPYEFVAGAQTFTESGPGANVAGGHPDVSLAFRLVTDPTIGTGRAPQAPRTVITDLPIGLLGDPKAADICPLDDAIANEKTEGAGRCPRRSAIGVAAIDATYVNGNLVPLQRRRVFRVAARPNEVAAFATSIISVPVRIAATVSPEGGYRVRATADNLTQAAILRAFSITLWGVPADRQGPAGGECDGYVFGGSVICIDFQPANSTTGNPNLRYGAPLAGAPRHPFMTNPGVCGASLDAGLRIVPYGTVFSPITATMSAGTVSGCERQPFNGALDVTPGSTTAGLPGGYTVGIDVSQNQDGAGVASAHVKDVEVALPEGVAISPGSANGLDACSDAQLDINGDSDVRCPAASRIGAMTVESPVLDKALAGEAYLGTQRSQDPASGEMYRLFLVVKGQGVLVKLKGAVKADPLTGRLTARFENNPQLPFSRIELRLDDGPRASLVNPSACGRYETKTDLTSWSGKAISLTSPMDIDQGCGSRGFAPSFAAGTQNPVAGSSSPFSLAISREDRSEELKTLTSLKLPEGLLGRVASVALCADADADRGTCPAASRLGHVQVNAGTGEAPVSVPQQGKAPTSVSLAGPYKGAPYSLSVTVPAQAGPFDLGRIVVRSPLQVNRVTSQLSTNIDVSRLYDADGRLDQVIDGPMPTIVKGIPLHVRDLRVVVDREGFMVNPTDCTATNVTAQIGSEAGTIADVSSRFQVGDCAALAFAPRLAVTVGSKGSASASKAKASRKAKARRAAVSGPAELRDGGHPALSAHLEMDPSSANNQKATVALPLALALDPDNANGLCEPVDAARDKCPAASIVGSVSAVSPLLSGKVAGPVYFVRGERIDPKSGRIIRTLPKLFVPLTSSENPLLKIDLHASSAVVDERLVTTFGNLPDVPISSFDLKIDGGAHGILVVSNTNMCGSTQYNDNVFTAQSNKRYNTKTGIATACPLAVVKSSRSGGALNLTVGGVAPGKVTISGNGLAKKAKTIPVAKPSGGEGSAVTVSATTHTSVAVPLSKATRRALAAGRDVKVKVTVAFRAQGATKATKTTKTITIHTTKQQ